MGLIFRVAGFNLGLLLAGLMVAELIFGGWVFGQNYGTLVIPKNFTRVFDVTDLYGGGRILYKRDEHGLRGTYRSPSDIGILVIGGSTTNEIFIDEEKTWSAVIAREFRNDGHPVSVVNAGLDGQSTVGNIKNFELWFPKIPGLKARYVLALLGVNDTAVAMGGDTYFVAPVRQSKHDRMFDMWRPAKRYLLNNSAIYALFRNVRGIIRARDANLIHRRRDRSRDVWREPAEAPDIEKTVRDMKVGLDLYEDRLRELTRRIRAFGAEPVYVTQHWPTYRIRDGRILGRVDARGVVALEHYAPVMALNRRTMRVCRDVEAVCIDLAAAITLDDEDTYDDLHTTPKGSEKIGEYLFQKLRPLFIQ